MKIADLMQRHVPACRLGDTLNHAARLMWERGVGCVVVLDGDGRAAGIVTDRDISMGAYTTGRPLERIGVEESMSKRVVCCRPDQDLRHAEDLMREHRIRRLPVVDAAGHVAGLLSLDDMACHLGFGFDGAAGALSGAAIAMTLAATSEHPPPPAPPAV